MADWLGTNEEIKLAKELKPQILKMYDEILTYTEMALKHDGNKEGLEVLSELRQYVENEIRDSTYTGAWIHQRAAVKSHISAARILLFYYVEIIHEGIDMDGKVIKERKKRIALIEERMKQVGRFLRKEIEKGNVIDQSSFAERLRQNEI